MKDISPVGLQLFVDRLAARSVLDDEEREAILALPTRSVEVRARMDFIQEHEEISYSCFIASGMVGRYGQTREGKRQITAFHNAGDMADLHSAVRPIGTGGLHAVCDTTVLRVPHTAIRQIAARYPALAEAFWRDCMLDAAILSQWVVNVGQRDARTRLAHILCEMSIRSGIDREVVTKFALPMTQAHLGEAAALTPVHVNRSLRAMRAEGLVTFIQGRVEIHDWEKLVMVGEFDSTYLLADTGSHRQKRLLIEV